MALHHLLRTAAARRRRLGLADHRRHDETLGLTLSGPLHPDCPSVCFSTDCLSTPSCRVLSSVSLGLSQQSVSGGRSSSRPEPARHTTDSRLPTGRRPSPSSADGGRTATAE